MLVKHNTLNYLSFGDNKSIKGLVKKQGGGGAGGGISKCGG